MDETSLEDMPALLKKAENLRMKFGRTGRYSTDQEGAGKFAYSLASGYILLCDQDRALDELEEAARYYGGLDHESLEVRLEYQKLRLSFNMGEHRKVLFRGPKIQQLAQVHVSMLCECIAEYCFWSALFSGEKCDGQHPRALFDLFYQNSVVKVHHPQNDYLESVLQLYLHTVNLVNDVHKLFPLYHRNANQDHLKINLKRVTDLATSLITDEVALFMVRVCQGIAQVYSKVEGGLEILLGLNQPFIHKSPVLTVMHAAAVVEALVLTPYNPAPREVEGHIANLQAVRDLSTPEQNFVFAWMRNLCPHALWLSAPEKCQGMLFVTQDRYVKVGAEDQKLSGFPLKNMCENMLGVLGDIPLTRSQCVNAAKHESFMIAYGIDRVIYQSFIQAFEEQHGRGGHPQ